MAQGTLWMEPIQRVWTNTGSASGNSKLYFYIAGTTTPIAAYSDVGLTTPYPSPIVSDANGIFPEIFLTPGTAYKVDLQDANGVSLSGYPADNQLATPASSAVVDTTETAGETLTGGQGAYISDGSGGKTQGLLYKWDAANTYSSTTPIIGIVPSAIASGSSGTFRQMGQVTVPNTLTVGSAYFVGTAGALSTTPGADTRYVGQADGPSTLLISANPPAVQNRPTGAGMIGGRLTLTTGTPVTVNDVTAATTLFYTPYISDRVDVYDGTIWSPITFTEISIAVPNTASQAYDVFLFNNGGTAALELSAWSNDSTRSVGLTLLNGRLVKTGTPTRRYLGSFRTTTVSGQTEDSVLKRYVWNNSNRTRRPLQRFETAGSWAYNSATIRQANGNTANQVEIMQGLAESVLDLTLMTQGLNTTNGAAMTSGFGEDVTNAFTVSTLLQFPTGNVTVAIAPRLVKIPAIGRHFYAWLESNGTAATGTFYGATAGSNGLIGWIEG